VHTLSGTFVRTNTLSLTHSLLLSLSHALTHSLSHSLSLTLSVSLLLSRLYCSFNRASDFEKALMQINESSLVEQVFLYTYISGKRYIYAYTHMFMYICV